MPLPVVGVEVGTASAGIKKSRAADLALISFWRPIPTAVLFTQNRFVAAPVTVAKDHLNRSSDLSRAWLINSGNANCGTGPQGIATARASCKFVAAQLGCTPAQVLPFSTGVIMESLSLTKLVNATTRAHKQLGASSWLQAAKAIMTTDTKVKAATRQLPSKHGKYTVTGIAKGSGMIHPQMATMLAFIVTDAHLSATALKTGLRKATATSFNQISVDGETSTNDAVALAATGAAGKPDKKQLPHWQKALEEVCGELAMLIVNDGEGATCVATIEATGFASNTLCRQIADSVACSPLIKTMLHARDPNIGRLLMAIGKVPGDYNPHKIKIRINNKLAFADGRRVASFNEQQAQKQFSKPPMHLQVSAGKRPTSAKVTFCDLSAKYVNINSEYRS